MGVASLTPAFPKIAQELQLNKTQVGLLISVFTLPGIFLTPIAGILADRIGRKKVLIPSLLIFAFIGIAYTFNSYEGAYYSAALYAFLGVFIIIIFFGKKNNSAA
jgi:MFS family permease